VFRIEPPSTAEEAEQTVAWPAAQQLGHSQPHRRGCIMSVTSGCLLHRWSSVLGPVALMPAPLVGCWSSPHLGRTWLQEQTERLGSRRRPKRVHRISDRSNDAERTFFGPSTPDGPCASRIPPAESAGPAAGCRVPRRGARSARPILVANVLLQIRLGHERLRRHSHATANMTGSETSGASVM